MNVVLVGAGGHAMAIVEALTNRDDHVTVYVDPHEADWLDARHVTADADVIPDDGHFVMGIGGTTPEALARRLALYNDYLARGFETVAVIHSSATVSPSATVEPGAVVLAGAIVQPGARIGESAIINTGAIVEHGSRVGAGAHIAPGAILLGDCAVGRCAMIGAGAILLPGSAVAAEALIPVGRRYRNAE